MASSGDFCTLNPLGAQGGGTIDIGTLSNGNLSCALTDTAFGNFGVTSGKWYWEWRMVSSATSGSTVGWANQQVNSQPELGYNSPASATGVQMVYMYLASSPMTIVSDAPKSNTYGGNADVNTIVQNDIIGIAADFDNDKWYFSINGSFDDMRSGQNPSTGSSPMCSASGGGGLVTIARTAGYTWFPAIGNWAAPTRDYTVNFGQDDTFGGAITAAGNADDNGFGVFKYAPPTGFLAMCSGNLSVSSDIDPAQTDDDYPGKQCGAILYTGNGSTNAITGLGFKPDLIWLANMASGYDRRLVDSVRGAGTALRTNSTAGDVSESNGVTAFGTDGFTLGSEAGYNANSGNYVAWCWRAGGSASSDASGDITVSRSTNDASKFSICTWSGNGVSGSTIAHGLGVKPSMTIIKKRESSAAFNTWHQGVNDGDPDSFGEMQSTASWYLNQGSSGPFTTAPGTDYLTLTAYSQVNGGSNTYVGYFWADVEGMQKFGGYTGNGNSDGTFVYTGFRPTMVLTKRWDGGTEDWGMFDTKRAEYNPTSAHSDGQIQWNSTAAASAGSTHGVDFLSNGFKLRGTGGLNNQSGGDYIYMAFADVPFKYNNTF